MKLHWLVIGFSVGVISIVFLGYALKWGSNIPKELNNPVAYTGAIVDQQDKLSIAIESGKDLFLKSQFFRLDPGHYNEELIHCFYVSEKLLARCTRGLTWSSATTSLPENVKHHFGAQIIPILIEPY